MTDRIQGFSIDHGLEDSCSPAWMVNMNQFYNLSDNKTSQLAREQARKRDHPLSTRKMIFATRNHKENPLNNGSNKVLQKLLKKNKVQRLVNNFISKLKRNVALRMPAAQDSDNIKLKKRESVNGITLNQYSIAAFNTISIILTLLISIVYSLAVIFPQAQDISEVRSLKILALVFFTLEMGFSFLTKKFQKGKTLNSIRQISYNYLKTTFLIDFFSLLMLLLSFSQSIESTEMRILRLCTFAKNFQYSQKLQSLQKLLVTNVRREQHIQLLSILFINLCFAHILSILLNSMTLLNPSKNWLTQKGLADAPWYQRYIWGYYWGTTIMLTVGFGDIAATNAQQAFCLTFIELFSCLTLSYNINCLGNILSNIRMQHLEKRNSIKTFGSMVRANHISEELQQRINSFIQGNYLIKEEFNFREQDHLLEDLPTDLQKEYMRQANLQIFQNLLVMKNFTLKIQRTMAQKIIKKVTHSDELLIKKGQNMKLMILKKGQIGFCTRYNGQQCYSVTVDTIKVDSKTDPKLVSLGFIKSRKSPCDIKSLTYSILFYFEQEEFQQILKQSHMDYEHYCMLRDQSQYLLNQYQLYPCKECKKEFHSKLDCPKYHYVPLKQHILNKYLFQVSKNINKRISILRSRLPFEILKQREQNLICLFDYRVHVLNNNEKQQLTIEARSQNCDVQTIQAPPNLSSAQRLSNLGNFKDQYVCYPTNVSETDEKKEKLWDIIKAYIKKNKEDFWDLELDEMYNWRYYKIADNPDNLQVRTKKGTRKMNSLLQGIGFKQSISS